MSDSISACQPKLLPQSLDDRLTEAQEERLAAHLSGCRECRETLEELAAVPQHWKRIETCLKRVTSGDHSPETTGCVSKLIPVSPPTASFAYSHASDVRPQDFAVDFLQPTTNPDALGTLNNIEIRAIIGHGGNGVVLKGFQEELNRLVAVKVMAPQLATSAAARRRFAREAQATAAIVHPNVMPILTVHSAGQLPYLVMPYVDCESLQERLNREGSLPTLDVLRIGHQVANGLAAAHAQALVHRDVKPANILLEKGVDRVMLTDFGLARAADDATLTRTGLIAGTPQYMSPEQARGDAIDTRSDLFSLGSVMYAMTTGRPPFRAETTYGILRRVTDEQPRQMSEINAEIPNWLCGMVSRLMAKSVADRFEHADHVASLLEDCIAHVQQPRVNALPEELSVSGFPGWMTALRRNPFYAVAFTVVLFFVAAAVSFWSAPELESTQEALSATVPLTEDSSIETTWKTPLDDDMEELDRELDSLLESF